MKAMLTPQQVKNHRFQLGSRGTYRAEEVDAFVQELTASFEEAYTQNEALLKKISLLADKVEEYRRDEDTIRSALLVAQRTADQVVREAQEKADARLAQAEGQAKELEADAAARSGKALQEASDRAQTLTREADARVSALLGDASAKAESLVREAQAKADHLVAEAGRHAQENLAQLRGETERESLLLDQTRSAVSTFRADLIAMYKEHIELINRLPSLPEQEQAPAERPEPAQPEALAEPAEPRQGAASHAEEAPVPAPEEPEAEAGEPEAEAGDVPTEETAAQAPAAEGEPPIAQPDPDPMSQFRTIYSEEDEAGQEPEEATADAQEAQLTMGEPGFHLNLDEIAGEEPQNDAAPGGIGKDGVPTFEGFFRKKH